LDAPEIAGIVARATGDALRCLPRTWRVGSLRARI
jgi:hypothetical protein